MHLLWKDIIFLTVLFQDLFLSYRCRLRKTWDNIIDIEALGDETVSSCLEQPNLEKIFIKLKLWKLTQFTKCVFLDTDTLVLQNVDDLFERDELSASPDVGWPDCFNSGVFVYVPSLETYASLIKHAEEHGSFDGKCFACFLGLKCTLGEV